MDPRQVPGAAHAVHPAPGPRVDRYRPFVVPGAAPIQVDLVASNATLALAQTMGLVIAPGADGTAA